MIYNNHYESHNKFFKYENVFKKKKMSRLHEMNKGIIIVELINYIENVVQ